VHFCTFFSDGIVTVMRCLMQRSLQRMSHLLLMILILIILQALAGRSAQAVVVPPEGSPIFIQTNGPTAPMSRGDWYTSVENGARPGYHYYGIFVPCGWPANLDFEIDLYSPEINVGVPNFDEPRQLPHESTTFELYLPGTAMGTPDLPGPGGATSIISATYAPSNKVANDWVRFHTLVAPVTCGQYLLRAQTRGNDENSWRLRFGSDDDNDPNTLPPANYDNPDGLIGSGDEAVVGIAQTTYQHFDGVNQCLTLYQFVEVGLNFARFHNFDMDANVRVVYYPPSATYDPTGLNGQGIAGTVSGETVWNNGTRTTRGGDVVANPEPGWWRIVSCVRGDNQFNQEGQLGVPTFYQPLPEPDIAIAKDDGQSETNPGGILTYTIAFTNTSLTTRAVPGAALNVAITDTLASETTFLSCGIASLPAPMQGGTCAHNAGVVVWQLNGPLMAGASGLLTVTVRVDPVAVGPLVNNVLIDYSDIIGNQYPPGRDDDSTLVRDVPVLVSTKTDRLLIDRDFDGLADALDIIEYTIGITNLGRFAAQPVTFTDTPDPLTRLVPGTVQVTSTTPLTAIVTLGNSPGDGTVAVQIAQLGPGASLTIRFQVEVRDPLPPNTTTVANQGLIETPNIPPVFTDDPETPQPGDPTETPVDPPRGGPPTAISLLSFVAQDSAEGVVLTWVTGSELATVGFHLYRSADGTRTHAQQVTLQRIVARGSATSGAAYEWVDKNTISGVVYSYWLAEYEQGGATHEYGPVQLHRPATAAQHLVYLPMLLR
jgi:uncharacterized repeat protein (TIGR01451 family)